MAITKTAAKLVKDGKFSFLYLKNVPVYFVSVHEPKKKYSEPLPDAKNQSKREYQLTAFVDSDTREYLEDTVLINKQVMAVGRDKTKKRKIKYPLSSQLKEDEKVSYDDVDGMHGISLTLNELTNQGKPAKLIVVGKDGKPFEENIGNGSICNIKCFGYTNRDDQLVVSLNLVQVVEHVPYEGGSGGQIVDNELGISYEIPQAKESKPDTGFDFDDDVPFEVDSDDDLY
jgi:hypothetical protein